MRLTALSTMLAFLAVALGSRAADPTGVAIQHQTDRIDFRVGSELVASYLIALDIPKPYLWPLNAPGGILVTRSAPPDHVHHVSGWFCHGDVIPESLQVDEKPRGVDGVDFWSVRKWHGQIVCSKVENPGAARVRTYNEWRTHDGRKVLDEVRSIRLEDLGTGRLFIFDVDILASVSSLTFGDTKEGSFAVRVSEKLDLRKVSGEVVNPKSKITNANGGQGEKDCWGQPSDWCDYSGEINGQPVGVSLFDHPDNKPRACWHVRDYGLLAANPFGREKSTFPAMKGRTDLFKLAKGERLKLRYGIFTHTGDVGAGKVAEAFQKFTATRE